MGYYRTPQEESLDDCNKTCEDYKRWVTNVVFLIFFLILLLLENGKQVRFCSTLLFWH